MDVVGRLFLRFLVVPLGAVLAIAAGAACIVIAEWNAVQALVRANAQAQQDYVFALLAAGPLLVQVLSTWVVDMAVPAAIGILIAETFAIRSWIFHAANGGLSAWIGWTMAQDVRGDYHVLTDPRVLLAAGLAAGLAYWAVAGWSAGFWRTVGRRGRAPA